MAWLREQRLGSLSTSSAGTLMTDESYMGKAGSYTVSTGEGNVWCGVLDGSIFPFASLVFLCISSVFKFVSHFENGMAPGTMISCHV